MFSNQITIVELAEELLTLGLKWSTTDEPRKERALHARSALQKFIRLAQKEGHSPEAINAAHFALSAYLDEKGMADGETLQLCSEFHGEPDGGEMFFKRLDELDVHGSLHSVKQLYLLCLVFGFEGCYRNLEGELADEALLREAEALWERSVPSVNSYRPHG